MNHILRGRVQQAVAIGVPIAISAVSRETAQDMARVGIIPSTEGPDQEPAGHLFEMGGQRFVVTGYATRAEFLEAVSRADYPPDIEATFHQCPQHYYFQRISTD